MEITAYIVQRDDRLAGYTFVNGMWRGSFESDDPGFWPAPRPGTPEVAASRGAPVPVLMLHPGDREVPGSRTDPPAFIAPRLPHYAIWAPDGRTLCYVTPRGQALELKTWAPGAKSPQAHLSAAPLFPAWRRDGQWLAVHHNTVLTLIDVTAGEQRIISSSATGFRTPAFSDSGLLAWGEVEAGQAVAKLETPDGEVRVAGRFGGGLALAFRPGSDSLCAAVASTPDGGAFSELAMQKPDGWRRLVAGPLVAYWWSPTGDRVAALHPSYTGDGRFQLRVYDADGYPCTGMEPLIPSSDTRMMVSFFDQYTLSHPAWSHDGRWFGMAGQILTDGPARSFSGLGGDAVWLWDTQGGGAPHRLSGGAFVTFNRAIHPSK